MYLVKSILISLMVFGLFLFTSCEEEVEPDVKNIVQIAQETPELSTLISALEIAGLTSALEGATPQTVFAPNNQAFQDLLDSNPAWNTLADIDKATLTQVLLFHVIQGEVKASDLSDTYVSTLNEGPNDEAISLQVNVTNGVSFNAGSTPITTDVEASNGVVHIINKVMLPPSVVDIASNNSDFSILVAALTRADLTTDYVATLSGDGPFTVFAPNNAAFQKLLDSNPDWNSLDDIPVATLAAVLNYHVVNGANVQSDELSDDQEVSMLEGKVTIDLSSGAKVETSSGQSVNIILTDVQGTNGVVHVIEDVLLP